MHKTLTITILFTLLAFVANSQPQSVAQEKGQPQNTPSGQYLRETSTTPYKASRKIKKQRRVATRKGNKALKDNNFSDAVSMYRSAIKADSNYSKAQYNVAIAHGKLQQNDSALAYYHRVCENNSSTREQRAHSHYNAGNIYLHHALASRDTGGYDGQSLHAAIEEYKSSLRLDPTNKDAQHNLSLAKQLLRPEQSNGGGGGGSGDQNQQDNQENQQDNKQDQQKQNQNQNQNQQDQQQNKEQESQNQGQSQSQNQQNKRDSKQQEQRRREAEQMLNAMKNNEQQTMRAVRAKETQKEGRPVKREKDW